MAILEPSVGFSLADSAIRMKCEKLRITPDTITAGTLPALADELYEPLRIFAGEIFARTLTARVRAIAIGPCHAEDPQSTPISVSPPETQDYDQERARHKTGR